MGFKRFLKIIIDYILVYSFEINIDKIICQN